MTQLPIVKSFQACTEQEHSQSTKTSKPNWFCYSLPFSLANLENLLCHTLPFLIFLLFSITVPFPLPGGSRWNASDVKQQLVVPHLPSPPDKKTDAYELNTSNTNALMTDMWQRHWDTQMQSDINGEICLWSRTWRKKQTHLPLAFNLGMKSNVRQD